MDPLSQGLLGSCVGQAFYGKKLGRRALAYGWFAGMFPDIDVISAHFGWVEKLKHHRGITHSLFFAPIASLLIGYIIWKLFQRNLSKKRPKQQLIINSHRPPLLAPGEDKALPCWIGLIFLCLFTHPLLDLFTTYGTQLFLPFSNKRFALNAIGIIDPFYTVPLLVAVLTGFLILTWKPKATSHIARIALALTTCYLFYGLYINHQAKNEAQNQLQTAGISVDSVQSYPSLLQPYLRNFVVKKENTIRFGHISMWKKTPIKWEAFTIQNHPLIQKLENTPQGKVFKWFTMNNTIGRIYHTDHKIQTRGNNPVKHQTTTIEIDDTRYGYSLRPGFSIWFIKAEFDQHNNLIGDVTFNRRPLPKGASVKNLFRAAFYGS